jgi:LAO/AO transport system kinase
MAGDRLALARLISVVERGGPDARQAGSLAHPHGGRAYTVGITGSPGAGKSTLTDRLIGHARDGGDTVGVLAVDPSSPFSGGAFLGDRIRMQDHSGDAGVFIRSMATRGHLGGLSLATPEVIRMLDAAGFPWVLVETVGVGQVEIEVAGAADTTVVVMNPGAGDNIQASKAGLLEVADVFVINKADRPGVAELQRDLQNMMEMNTEMGEWMPPIVTCVAAKGEGTDSVWAAVSDHRRHLESSGELEARRRRRVVDEMREIVVRTIEARAYTAAGADELERLADDVVARRRDPYDAASVIVDRLAPGAG